MSIRKEIFKARLKYLGVGVYKDQMPGGSGDDKSPADFNNQILKKGAEHEMEHTYDAELAQEIAIDHLTEDPQYYEKLEKIESHTGSADFFLRTLKQVVGNKVYMRDIDALFSKLKLRPLQIDALDPLGSDLNSSISANVNRNSFKTWKGGF